MLRFYAASFVATVANLQHAEGLIAQKAPSMEPDEPMPDEDVARVRKAIENLSEACDELPVSLSLRRQCERLRGQLETFKLNHDMYRAAMITLLGEVKNNLANELAEHLCLIVPAQYKALWVEPEKWLGMQIGQAFPDAIPDMRDCVRCFALDQWTACVFHAMGLVQHGLRWLSDRMNVTFPRGIEVENWKGIIDKIEKEIRAMEQQPKTVERDDELQFYSSVASHFFYIKEAWRNHVMHIRRRYNEDDAHQVVMHVRQMMLAIAARESAGAAPSAP